MSVYRCAYTPADSCDWDLLLELLGVLEAEEERVEPALLARERGRGKGVMGGESSCGGGAEEMVLDQGFTKLSRRHILLLNMGIG